MSNHEPKQQNQVALVTGAASGIGEAVVERLLANDVGVVASDRAVCPARLEARWADSPVSFVAGDVADEAECARAVEAAIQVFGRLDILVNSAGIADTNQPTVEQDLEIWQHIVDVNLRGTYLMTREAGRAMLRARSGAVVSVAALLSMSRRSDRRTAAPQCLFRIQGRRRDDDPDVSRRMGQVGIRVNAVAPSYILTPMTSALGEDGRASLEAARRRTLLGRLGNPDEAPALIAFLASDLASFITGVIVPVDGGWSVFGGAGDAFTD